MNEIGHKQGLLAISPFMLFLVFYLVVSLIASDFYSMPLVVALVLASVWAVAVYRKVPLSSRIEAFSKEAGSSNVMYMIWIFILAGAFASLAKEIGSIDATVNIALRYLPSAFIVPGLFVASCFISLAIGTSVGTVVALTPLAVKLAESAGGEVAFFVASVLGGAFFGDNLSFISDTTIAATRTQGCRMKDKFKANMWIALPAAIVTLGVYVALSANAKPVEMENVANPLLLLPYLMVIVTALIGINVTVVLLLGIATTVIIALTQGYGLLQLAGFAGAGIDSMGNLIIVTLLAAGMLGLIKASGGINYILQCITSNIYGKRWAQAGIAFLVSIVNVCTANNTVAIITVGSLSKDIAARYGIDARKTASILDTCSCITQCLIPYGAQTLLATALAGISPAAPFPYLYYPWALIVAVTVSIAFRYPRFLS